MTTSPPELEPIAASPLPAGVEARFRPSELQALRDAFVLLKRGVSSALLERHRGGPLQRYLEQGHRALQPLLQAHQAIELKLEASTLVVGATPIFHDDSARGNIVYPLWAGGIRLLVLRLGLEPVDLLRFFFGVQDFEASEHKDDLATHLWKEDIHCIEWVVLVDELEESHPDLEKTEVEITESIVSYEQRSSDVDAPFVFTPVVLDDVDGKLDALAQVAQSVREKMPGPERLDPFRAAAAADERELLRRACTFLLELVRQPSTAAELDDLAAALEQLLDGLILDGAFGVVDTLLESCERLSRDADLPSENREMARACAQRFTTLLHDGQRMRGLAGALNAGRTRDLEGVRRHLLHLGPTATPMLLDLLDGLHAAVHRRLIADVLVEVGAQGIALFIRRLPTASSNLAKDLLYIIDRIDPPHKLEQFAPLLQHENAVIRLEALATIGRTKSLPAFRIVEGVLANHDVPQMRAHAARVLADYPAEWCEPILLALGNDPRMEQRADGEKRALVGAIAKLEGAAARQWIRGLFAEKSTLFRGKRVDDKKLMAIEALRGAPSMPALQLLSDIARDDKLHSREVRERAQAAALEVKQRMLGAMPPERA